MKFLLGLTFVSLVLSLFFDKNKTVLGVKKV